MIVSQRRPSGRQVKRTKLSLSDWEAPDKQGRYVISSRAVRAILNSMTFYKLARDDGIALDTWLCNAANS